jgi:hypothetical protein
MGLVLAIFCFIIGIPMFLGGLGLMVMGVQQVNDAVNNGLRVQKMCNNSEVTTERGCWEAKQRVIKENTEAGQPKVVGGGLLTLFAFLIKWGGNRTRRPKEVRIKHD